MSKKLIPASTARSKNGRAWSSGSDQEWLPRCGSPYVMQPRQIGETSRPVLPSFT